VEKLGITQGQIVVDFGCGPGYFTVELAKKAGKVVAVDLSSEMLEKAKGKAAKAHATNVEFLQATTQASSLKTAQLT
jgi:23S rRNA (uracil1939-C5)-methyltransferase